MKNERYVPLVDDKIPKTISQVVPQVNRGKYDPYRVPPDFAEAEGHRLATRIARPLNKGPNIPVTVDAATGHPIENQQLGLCCSIEDMNFLSPGYPMYFQWIRFCILIGLIVVIFSGIYNLQSFATGTACIDEHEMATIAQENSEYHSNENTTASATTSQTGETTTTDQRSPQSSSNPTSESSSTSSTNTQENTSGNNNKQTTQGNTAGTSPQTTTTTTTTNNGNTGAQTTTTTTTDAGLMFERVLQETEGNGEAADEDNDETLDESEEEQLGQLLEVCPKNWINRFSLANKEKNDFDLEKTDIYNFFTIIILLLVMQFVRKIQKQTAILCDERQITASDFTAKVANLPSNFTEKEDIDEEIRKFFIDHGLPGQKLNVQQVSVAYNCSELLAEDKKIKQNIEKRAQLLAKKTKHQLVSDDDIRKIEADIETSKRNMLTISNKFKEGVGVAKQFEGEAYVTFETQQELQKVLKHWKLGYFATLKERLTSNSLYKFRGNVLKVRQAPEPSDVYWENAGTSSITKFTLKLFTNIVTLILLCAGFYTIFIINSAKVNMLAKFNNEKASEQAKTFVITIQVKVISIAASVVVVIVNQILRIVIMFLTQREKFSTHTEFQSSYAMRLALCQFLNTALITFAVSVYFHNIAGPGGLTYTAFFIFVTNVLVQCGMVLFSPATLMYYWKRSRANKDKDTGKSFLTQQQLNALYKLPEYDFATKYAGYAKTIMSACFFAPLVPLVVVVATAGIIFEYALDKYVLLRHRSRGRSIGPELSFEFVEFLEYCMVLFSIGNFLANVNVSKFDISEENLTIIGVVIGLLNALLPMDKINEWIFPAKDEDMTDDRYSEVRATFFEDYNTSNPATEDAATQICRAAESQIQQIQVAGTR